MQVSRCVYTAQVNDWAMKDQNCVSQILMRMKIELGPQPGWGQTGQWKPPTKFLCIILEFKKCYVDLFHAKPWKNHRLLVF